MTLQPDHVLLWVSDMDRALRFYSSTIGLKIQSSSSRFSVVSGSRFSLSLHLNKDSKRQKKTTTSIVVLYSDDIDETFHKFQSNGIEILTPLSDASPGVRIFEFFDSEGNILSVSTARFE